MSTSLSLSGNKTPSSTAVRASRCNGCPFSTPDADGFSLDCSEETVFGGCVSMQPCGMTKFNEIMADMEKVPVAVIDFDYRAYEKTGKRTGVTYDTILGESFEEKEHDLRTSPEYKLNKMCWSVHQKTGHWVAYLTVGYTYTFYTDGDIEAVRAAINEYSSRLAN